MAAGASWCVIAGSLAVGGSLCLFLACFIYSPGMNCRADNLREYVDIWLVWGVSFSFLLMFQEYGLSSFDCMFPGSVSGVMVSLQFLFVFGVLLPDFFVPTFFHRWVRVELGKNCSIH